MLAGMILEGHMTDDEIDRDGGAIMEMTLVSSFALTGTLIGALISAGSLSPKAAAELLEASAAMLDEPLGPSSENDRPAAKAIRSYCGQMRVLASGLKNSAS